MANIGFQTKLSVNFLREGKRFIAYSPALDLSTSGKTYEEAKRRDDIGEELADVFNWILILSHDLSIDIAQASEKKIEKNKKKYPVHKAKGKHTKYDKL